MHFLKVTERPPVIGNDAFVSEVLTEENQVESSRSRTISILISSHADRVFPVTMAPMAF